MIIVIANYCDVLTPAGFPTGRKELLASHGIDPETDERYTMPAVPPQQLGAKWHPDLMEWVIEDFD